MFVLALPVVRLHKALKTRFNHSFLWEAPKQSPWLAAGKTFARHRFCITCMRRPFSPTDSLRGRFLPSLFDMENSALLPSEVGLNEEEKLQSLVEREKQGIISSPFGREGLKPANRIFWNRHSRAAKLRWENDEQFRERKRLWLKSGAETRRQKHTSKIKLKTERKRAYTLSEEGRARKRAKLQKRHRNVVEWMQERLDSGEELRRRIYDDEYKKGLQRERSRIAKERHKRMQEKMSKVVTDTEQEEAFIQGK